MVVWLLLLLYTSLGATQHIEEEKWELIGSRTSEWTGKKALRCTRWDKVAIRWHVETCEGRGRRRRCDGGSNVDYAPQPQNFTEFPMWHNAFTYVVLDKQTKKHETLHVGVGDEGKPVEVEPVVPMKIDVDWKWRTDENGCNHFTVRMSALSTIDRSRLGELERFCRRFDKDGFVSCDNL